MNNVAGTTSAPKRGKPKYQPLAADRATVQNLGPWAQRTPI
jgi:hypothetical protein